MLTFIPLTTGKQMEYTKILKVIYTSTRLTLSQSF